MEEFGAYLLRFGFNLIVVALVVALYSLPNRPNRNYVLALLMAGALVYVVVDQMVRVEIGLGVGFGIFALFSLLRFRTVPISVRAMTYLFTVVTLSLVNALLLHFDELQILLAVNLALPATLALLERTRLLPGRSAITLIHDDLTLIHPSRRRDLLADLRARTGLEPQRVVVDSINLRSGAAKLRVYINRQGEREK